MDLLDPERDYYSTAMKAKEEKDYYRYLVNLTEACNQGCKEAILEMHYFGLNYSFNLTVTAEYFINTAINNNSYSIYILGRMYQTGIGIQKDYSKAIELYKRAIELNNPCAMAILARMYLNGQGVQQDCKKAFSLYKRSVELNNPSAINDLALLYKKGRGVQKDYAKAIELYERAIKLNYPIAMNNLAYMYRRGEGTQKDYTKAIELYKRAVKLNNTHAINTLAYIYEYGKGTQQNYSKAIKLYIILNNHSKILEILKLVLMDNKGTKNDVENIKKLLVDIDLSQLKNVPICITMLQNLLNRNLKMIDMHFEFQEEGIGYEEAKNRFYSYV